MVDARLAVDYLGLRLPSPLVAAPSPLTLKLPSLCRLEEAGAGAVVLGSLFEESFRGGRWAGRAGSLLSPDGYLELIRQAKARLAIPVIASLNAASIGAWVQHVVLIQQAGADAIELDLALLAVDPDVSSARVERDYLDVVAAVRLNTTLPVAVKIPAAFTSLPAVLSALQDAGAGAAVLFHRPYSTDVDLDTLRMVPRSTLSDESELGPVLRWLGLLHGRVGIELAASGGVHSGQGAAKVIAAGARIALVCSALMQLGIERLAGIGKELLQVVEGHGATGVSALRGRAAMPAEPDPALLERAHYVAMFGG